MKAMTVGEASVSASAMSKVCVCLCAPTCSWRSRLIGSHPSNPLHSKR